MTPKQSIRSILDNLANYGLIVLFEDTVTPANEMRQKAIDEAHAQILAVFKEIIPFMVYEDGTPRKGDYVAGFNDARQLLLNSIGEMGKL